MNQRMRELAREMAHGKEEQNKCNKILRNWYYILEFFIYLYKNMNNNNITIIKQ